jgi:hypothetical protein
MKNLALLSRILYRHGTTEEEMSTEDRRAPGATRIPFEGLVEVGGAVGPTFEAQAVNVSEEGLQVRSAYLPEPGQPLTCRFDFGAGHSVLAAGEVAWARGANNGGELGIRFTDMDPESMDVLKRTCGADAAAADAPATAAGTKIRLHIEGLASPMRAKIRDSRTNEVTVGSDLGFLQVGKDLELEDPLSGGKRPASINAVDVVIDPATRVPQLIVTLRYTDAPATGPAAAADASAAPADRSLCTASAGGASADDAGTIEEVSAKMKGALARGAARLGPAIERIAQRAKTAIALLAKREGDGSAAPRRTTAPAPGGGLHTSGRRVVRGEAGATPGPEEGGSSRLRVTKRKAAVAGAVMIAAVLAALAIKRSHHEGTPSGAPAVAEGTTSAGPSATVPASPPPSTPATPPIGGGFSVQEPAAVTYLASPQSTLASGDDLDPSTKSGHRRHVQVAPFGNGPVHHGNMLHLKMDGPIEALEGAQQPTGFAVKLPGRRSLEAAGPLASRDSRIAAIKVSNDTSGAELTVAFKDGVPSYQVTAHGDTLVIALAPPGPISEKTLAKKDEAGGNGPKRSRPSHDRQKPEKR